VTERQNVRPLALAHAVYERASRRMRAQLPDAGLVLLPFAASSDDAASLVHLPHAGVEPARGRVASALRALLAEPGLPSPFDLPGRLLRIEERFGWRAFLGSSLYLEYFRPLGMAHQLLAGLADTAGAPRGLLVVSRAESETAFDERERSLILAARDEVGSALTPLSLASGSSRSDDILASVTAGLPIPAVLIDADGRVSWMSDEATSRLDAVAVTTGDARYYASSGSALGELVACALLALRAPDSASQARPGPDAPTWILRGERLVVRRQAGVERGVLVCLQATTAVPELEREGVAAGSGLGLSTREGDIAALAAEGYSVLAIASRLGIAESTVSSHLKRVYRKLGVRSRAELASRVVRAR
jgi:DNA-binding CsgD family transcriptional regulator